MPSPEWKVFEDDEWFIITWETKISYRQAIYKQDTVNLKHDIIKFYLEKMQNIYNNIIEKI